MDGRRDRNVGEPSGGPPPEPKRGFFATPSVGRLLTTTCSTLTVLYCLLWLGANCNNTTRARESSRAKSCVANLKQIDAATQQFAMDRRLSKDAPVSMRDLVPAYLNSGPRCPEGGGDYRLTTVDAAPTCPSDRPDAEHRHVLPPVR